MKLLGLTGNIACGKSTVGALLKERGAALLDADKLVHELYSDTDFSRQVAALFSSWEILTASKTVDRARLGAVVFKDAVAMRRLELLVHPAVAALRDEKLHDLQRQDKLPCVVVIEAVKLIESAQAGNCREVWCVICSPEKQLQRLMETRGLTEREARARLDAQPSLSQKQSLLAALNIPLVCIENNGSLENLKERVENRWHEFLRHEASFVV